ncbi:RnfABCDGE type electron transport complex subunit D [bacterium]|nr:RnfABCDGE type electron transport complex subunit D [bacterium]
MATESSKTSVLGGVDEGHLDLVTSPHSHFGWSTGRIMWTVSAALVPCVATAVWFFGFGVLATIAGAILGAAGTEWLVGRLNRRAETIPDGSAILTGLLLGLVVPPGFSPFMAFIGGVVAVGIGKIAFGGLGDNIFNPALVGRAFLQASFPAQMTDWSHATSRVDAISQATPLGLYKFGDPSQFAGDIATQKLLLGEVGGCIGATSSTAILIGAAILLITRIAHWQIMASMILGGLVFGGIFHVSGIGPSPLFHVLAGGFLFGAVFMATDYVTSPNTPVGMWIYGGGIALLTILIRLFGGLPEGVMYAILLMNATVPLINRHTRPALFGAK